MKSKTYCYDIGQFFNYFYYIEKKNPNNNLLHHLDNDILSKNYKSYQTTMKIVEDIDLPFTNSIDTQNIIYQIKKLYTNYEDELYKNILTYSTFKNNKLTVDNDFIILEKEGKLDTSKANKK